MKKIVILSAFVFSFLGAAFAQDGWDWGVNKPEAQGHWTYMNNLVKSSKYDDAHKEVSWLLVNAPKLHVSLYKQATKIYEELESKTMDLARKKELQDTVLALYDKRLEFFGDEPEVLNRKGLVAYNYLYARGGQVENLYQLYKKALELNGSKTFNSNMKIYMSLVCEKKVKKELTEEQVLAVYEKLSETLELEAKENAADPKKIAAIDETKTKIDEKLTSCVKVDCDFIIKTYGPKFEAAPTDLKLAKKINSLMIANKCVSNDLFIKTSQLILASEPSLGGYKQLAKVYKNMHKLDDALNMYEKAIPLSTSPQETADFNLEMAELYRAKGLKPTARTYALKAAEVPEKKAEAYLLIGDIYFNSYDACKDEDPVRSRAVFIAAYEKYKVAGASAKMAQAKQNFPSMEEIFLRNKNKGDIINTGCWINENVHLQSR